MKKQERELLKSLCSFKAEEFDENLLKFATPAVLGHLFFNRMQAVAYGVLETHGLLGKVSREFRSSLRGAYEQNRAKNTSFLSCVGQLEEALSECGCKYAMLKGAYLCKAYPEGYRTSNDIDLLVHSRDVTVIGNGLRAAGFRQGNVRNGCFVPATRREIIESKMMRGETVPYIKEINLPGIRFSEVDINFSLDYKPGDTDLLREMIDNTYIKEVGAFKVRTLKDDDFFVHLCSHLYKEATTLPWVEMMRDMTLYKYADIYMLLSDMSDTKIDGLFERAEKTGTSKICAFAVVQMSKMFNFKNEYAVDTAKRLLRNDADFIHTVFSPMDQKTFVYKERSIERRFFANDRRRLLEEVICSEGIKHAT